MTNANIQVTQFPDGIGTVKDNNVLAKLPVPIQGVAFSINDFDQSDQFSNIWTAAALGAGATDSRPLSGSGILRQTTAAVGAGDGQEYNQNAGGDATDTLQLVTGREAWFGARFSIDVADLSSIILGFVPLGSGLTPADGVYFSKPTGATEAFLIAENNATAQSSVSLGNIAADTFYSLGIYWDGEENISCQLTQDDGVTGLGNVVLPGANLPAVGLCPTFTVATGAAAAVAFDLDWVLVGGGR